MNTQIPSELKKNKVSDTIKPPYYIKFSLSIHTYLLFIDMNQKSYSEIEHEKWLQKEAKLRFIVLLVMVLGLMLLGMFSFAIVFEIYNCFDEEFGFWNFISGYFDTKNTKVALTIISIFFIGITRIATIVYWLFLKLILKYKYLRDLYLSLRNQIYEFLTMIIFAITFITLLVKLTFSQSADITQQFDFQTVPYLLAVCPAYIHSIFSKMYITTIDSLFPETIQRHLKSKFSTDD